MDDELKAKGSGNYKHLDKTRVKLFPNFTRHHLVTHTYFITEVREGVRSLLTRKAICGAFLTQKINLGLWETAHLPLPYANIFSLVRIKFKYWLRGGIGEKFTRNLN